jgi:hypothetical protein
MTDEATAPHLFTETLALANGLWLQASDEKFRLHRLAPWEPAPPDQLSATGDPASTRQLMAGAFYAGLSSNRTAARPRNPLLGHIFGLAAGYRTTGSTPTAERRAADRLAARGQHEAAANRRHVAEEETGHDQLAMMDIAALGLDVEAFVTRLQPATALAMAARQRALADSDEPIAVTGYAYALERWALFTTAEVIEAIERAMPPGVRATRCLRVHSAVGSDAGHVDEALVFIAGLPARDRAIVARETFATVNLVAAEDDYPGDEAMRALLAELHWPHLHTLAA